MFIFVFKFIIFLIIIFIIYYFFNKKDINILEIIILLIITNICLYSLYNNLSIIETIILTAITISIYYLYQFLFNNLNKISEDKILINRGIINFNNLIKINMSYDKLIYYLKKQGINDPSLVDYCIKRNHDLIIFNKNSVKNYPISIVIDGNVLKDNLFSINKDIEWLNGKLIENNLTLKNINYAYFKNKNIYFITNLNN